MCRRRACPRMKSCAAPAPAWWSWCACMHAGLNVSNVAARTPRPAVARVSAEHRDGALCAVAPPGLVLPPAPLGPPPCARPLLTLRQVTAGVATVPAPRRLGGVPAGAHPALAPRHLHSPAPLTADAAAVGQTFVWLPATCPRSPLQSLAHADQQRFRAQAAAEIGAALPKLLYPLMAEEQVRGGGSRARRHARRPD